jgi:hypothetical protein
MTSWKTWCIRHLRLLTYGGGSLLIGTWTVLRFLTQRTIFDLVGQQVLTQQLLHGSIAGATIGVTNYIPKMFILYAPMVLLPASPRLKLIALTVAVNIATLILIGLALEKILRIFGVRTGGALYVGLVWLAAIAGSVFWIQFTNSRNLEVAGGLFLLYGGLRYLEQPGHRRLLAIAVFSAILFFADTLQLYMTAVPLIAYSAIICRHHRWERVAWLAGALVMGYAGSKLFFISFAHLLSIRFTHDTGATAAPSLHALLEGIVGAITATARLYSGGVDAGNFRRAFDGLFLCLLAAVVGYAIWHKLLPRRLSLLAACIIVVNLTVYIVSGQAAHPDTERYLIMTAPAAILLLGASQKVWQRFQVQGTVAVCIFLVVNSLFLGKTIVQDYQLHFSQDSHLASVERYITLHPTVLPYGSMDTAIPASYLSGSDQKAPLPLGCAGAALVKDSLFYSTAAFRRRERQSRYTSAAVVLDDAAITNIPSVCNEADIVAQLGRPQGVAKTDDGSTVLLYNNSLSSTLHY